MITKRIFDIFFSLLFSPILLILFIILFFLNSIFNGFPTLFIQRRIGYRNKKFNIYKFRTFPVNVDENFDINSLNRWSKFLRVSSLDEIPEFYNVLIGNMSLVGPRPLLEEYLPLYNEDQIRRHNVKPGITGLAQISGGNSTSWKERLELDIKYVENQSFFIDMKILFNTICVVLSNKDIFSKKITTIKKFEGINEK